MGRPRSPVSQRIEDDPDKDSDTIPSPEGIEEARLKDEEMLEAIPLPEVPGHEKARRENG